MDFKVETEETIHLVCRFGYCASAAQQDNREKKIKSTRETERNKNEEETIGAHVFNPKWKL